MKKKIIFSALAALIFVVCTSSALLPVTVVKEDIKTIDSVAYDLNPDYINYLKKESSSTIIGYQNFKNYRFISEVTVTENFDTIVNRMVRKGYVILKLNVASVINGRDTSIQYAYLSERILKQKDISIALNPSANTEAVVTQTTGFSKTIRFKETRARIKTMEDSTTNYYRTLLLTDNRKQDSSYFKRSTGSTVDTFYRVINGLKSYDTVRVR